ncbi:MAG: hypothetical protein VX278_09885 [Myxococcota bacterium]|nr:hypothetical protein [Myxococcota bacterium]
MFFFFIGFAFMVAGSTYQMPEIARWVGFLFAAYAAVANDSIQTIGTFIASNKQKPWWVLWFFIGGIFLATMGYSWSVHGGDVTYERLASKGFDTTPTSFSFLQVAAPIFLLILTRMKMPVSTTLLLLTSFSTEVKSVGKVLMKSFTGYFLAMGIALVVWMVLSKQFDKWFKGEAHPLWRVGQWMTTGLLWSVWLMQDAANIAVYLPRQLRFVEFLGFALPVFIGLGILFKTGGERVQEIVEEKSHVVDVRAATMIDLIYAGILFYFKLHSKIPMSTTWVFLGLIGGREIAMSLRNTSGRSWITASKMMAKDTSLALIGLAVSLLLAVAVNDAMQAAFLNYLGF